MLVQSTTVVNGSDSPKWLKDRQIPGGRVRMEPGATLLVSQGVWLRNRRSCRAWLQKVDDGRVLAHTLKNEKPVAPDTAESVSTLEAVAETEPVETAEFEETGESATTETVTKDDPLAPMKLRDLKPIGEKLGIPWKVGTSTDNYREIIRAKLMESEV
jgi:hypothetical protein